MNYREWIKSIDDGRIRPLYLVQITEPFLWDGMREVLQKDVLRQSMLDFNYEEYRMLELSGDRFWSAVEKLPLMAEKRVMIIDEVPLSKEDLKKNEPALFMLQEYAEKINPNLILVLGYRGDKIFRGKIVKALEKSAQFVELNRLTRAELTRFIQRSMQQKKIKAEVRIADVIIERSGYLEKDSRKTLYDVQNITDQVQGLAQEGVLRAQDAENALMDPLEKNIFALMDAVSAKKIDVALKIVQDFQKQQIDPFYYMNMLARQTRNLIGVQQLAMQHMAPADVQRRLKLSPFEYKKLAQAVRHFSEEELLEMHDRMFDMERRCKTESTDVEFAIERWILALDTGDK